MLSREIADRMAEVLGGRVWVGGDHVRVYVGRGKAETVVTLDSDGRLVVQCGRGVYACDVIRSLYDAGLVTGTPRTTGYGAEVIDDARVAS